MRSEDDEARKLIREIEKRNEEIDFRKLPSAQELIDVLE